MNSKTIERLTPHPEHLRKMLEDPSIPDMTMSILCTAMLLSEWQASCTFPTNHSPSFVMVNAGASPDPCMKMACAAFHSDLPKRRPPPATPQIDPITQKPQFIYDIPKAELAMRHHIAVVAKSGPPHPSKLANSEWTLDQKTKQLENHALIFGSTNAGYYSRHIHPDFGVATGESNRVSLWITSPDDLAHYKADLKNPNSILWKPWGYDTGFIKCAKHVSIVGSITSEEWSPDLVDNIIDHSAPVVFLPHPGGLAPDWTIDEFEFSKILRSIGGGENKIRDKMPPPDCNGFPGKFREYELLLRYRLRTMPADYEFHILQLIRHLHTRLCYLSATLLIHLPDSQKEIWRSSLLPVLFDRAIRGIALGVESLVYHGYGMVFGVHLDVAKKLLIYLRQSGPCSTRDIARRFQKVKSDTRDTILKLFEDEGLIVRDQKMITAVPCRDFLISLPTRHLMPRGLELDENQIQAIPSEK